MRHKHERWASMADEWSDTQLAEACALLECLQGLLVERPTTVAAFSKREYWEGLADGLLTVSCGALLEPAAEAGGPGSSATAECLADATARAAADLRVRGLTVLAADAAGTAHDTAFFGTLQATVRRWHPWA